MENEYIPYLDKLNELLTIPEIHIQDVDIDYFKCTTKQRFHMLLSYLHQPNITGKSRYKDLIYSIENETLQSILKTIENPVLLHELYDYIYHPDYPQDRSVDCTNEIQIYIWKYNSDKYVFLLDYGYSCEYHSCSFVQIFILTPQQIKDKIDEYTYDNLFDKILNETQRNIIIEKLINLVS
jgi:hypothetical protein